jgi:hypothetical protein
MLRVRVSNGLPNFQSVIAGAKTHHLENFFISLECYWNLDSKMGLHRPFGHLKHKLWPKERPGVKLAVWLPTTKTQESTQFPSMQVACDIPLESSWQGQKLCFRSHCDQRFACEVMHPQSRESPNGRISMERHKVYYKGGRWWLPPQVRAVVNLVCLSCVWFVLAPKVLQLCINHFVLVLCKSV